jgi:hypothetical protein
MFMRFFCNLCIVFLLANARPHVAETTPAFILFAKNPFPESAWQYEAPAGDAARYGQSSAMAYAVPAPFRKAPFGLFALQGAYFAYQCSTP